MGLPLSIAIRFLKSSRGQTMLIIIGIAVGVSVQIFIGSLIEGLQISLIDKTIGNSPQVTILPEGKQTKFKDSKTIIDELDKDKSFSAVSQSFDSSGFIFLDDELYPVFMRGVEFKRANEIYKFEDKLIEGKIPSKQGEVMLGKNLVDELSLKLNSDITFQTPDKSIKEQKVVGIYDLKVAQLNETWVITNLENAQAIFSKQGQISSIETQVTDVFAADTVGEKISDDIESEKIQVLNWKDQNEELLSGLSGQSASSYIIQVFVLLSVLLGISSVLAISVVQKSKQIGILKAMGIKDKTASLVFLFQGLILGTIGSVLGMGLGLSLTFIFSNFVKNSDGTPLVPFYLDYKFIGVSILIAIVFSTLAALIPARKSSKLDPIEVIKNG